MAQALAARLREIGAREVQVVEHTVLFLAGTKRNEPLNLCSSGSLTVDATSQQVYAQVDCREMLLFFSAGLLLLGVLGLVEGQQMISNLLPVFVLGFSAIAGFVLADLFQWRQFLSLAVRDAVWELEARDLKQRIESQ